ncbi:hypothetical protein [Bradyrhizobium sp. URHD0069]|uniref:hypothetical protein n=1 Tax=Bradyrhizobium sp. URHD0069 TaxID=1380355 RepID=UPI000AE235DD|nr:hypothetical protein [Bradyrhizobium sp. URHD0069]
MSPLSKTLIAAAARAAMATAAFSLVSWEFNPGLAYMYSGPGTMTTMAMASGAKNHEAMMKDAKKVPNNNIFFMDGGQMYMVSGTLGRPATSIGPESEPRASTFFLQARRPPLAGGLHGVIKLAPRNPTSMPPDATSINQ